LAAAGARRVLREKWQQAGPAAFLPSSTQENLDVCEEISFEQLVNIAVEIKRIHELTALGELGFASKHNEFGATTDKRCHTCL